MAWVVEITGVDPSDGVTKSRTYALGAGVAFTDTTFTPSGLVSWTTPTQKIDISREGRVTMTGDAGSMVLQNLPDAVGSAGPLDALADWAWHGRRANLYWVPALVWADRFLVATATMQQPLASLAISGSYQSTLVFPLRDPRSALTGPIQTTRYAGSNSGGSGVEGEADIKGRPKPILYGVVSNIPGVRVNNSKLIWQISDKAATILCVRDGGAAITPGVSRGTLSSLQTNIPAAGKFDYYSGSEGLFVRMGTTPQFKLTFDAQEGANAAARTHAQIWQRIRTERCGNVSGDITAASVTATDTADGNEVGFWWADDVTQLEALNEVLDSLSGYEVQGFDLKWSIAKLLAPSGTAALDFVVITPTSKMTSTQRPMKTLTRVRPNFAPDGAPPFRVTVRWGRNYTVMGSADFAGVTAQRLKDKFAQEWRSEVAADNTIWNPVARTGKFPDAPELFVNTGYQPGVDGLTCPHAATEATRLLNLYSTLKGQYKLSFKPSTADRLLPGDVISITHGQMLGAGPKFRVLQAAWKVDDKGAEAELIAGLQT